MSLPTPTQQPQPQQSPRQAPAGAGHPGAANRQSSPYPSSPNPKAAGQPVPQPPKKKNTNAVILTVVIVLAVALVAATVAVLILQRRNQGTHDRDSVYQASDDEKNISGATDPFTDKNSDSTEPSDSTGSYDTYYITGADNDGLNLRTEPGENSGDLRMRLTNGTKVGLVSTDETAFWYVYAYDAGVYGYVRKNYLTPDANAVTAPTAYYVIQIDTMTVYSDASDADPIGQLSTGDEVTVLAKPVGSYWYVRTAEEYGYVLSAGLDTERPTAAPTTIPDVEPELIFGRGDAPSSSLGTYFVVDVAYYLALRTEKAYDNENEIGKLSNGESVELIKEDGLYWYVYASSLGMYGYVNSDYLSKTRPATTSSDTYYVTDVTYYLALRTACAYDEANEIGKIYNDEAVVYVRNGTNGYWYVYVPSLDQYGYVNSKYLRK